MHEQHGTTSRVIDAPLAQPTRRHTAALPQLPLYVHINPFANSHFQLVWQPVPLIAAIAAHTAAVRQAAVTVGSGRRRRRRRAGMAVALATTVQPDAEHNEQTTHATQHANDDTGDSSTR